MARQGWSNHSYSHRLEYAHNFCFRACIRLIDKMLIVDRRQFVSQGPRLSACDEVDRGSIRELTVSSLAIIHSLWESTWILLGSAKWCKKRKQPTWVRRFLRRASTKIVKFAAAETAKYIESYRSTRHGTLSTFVQIKMSALANSQRGCKISKNCKGNLGSTNEPTVKHY